MTTSHDNNVSVSSSQITAMSYIEGSLVITGGQPSSPPPSFSQSGDSWKITLKAGRKGSSSVADSFNKLTGGQTHEYAPSGGGGGTPDKLNFYFGVTMTFTVGSDKVPVNVYFGQGHFATVNNWWIGSSNVINDGNPDLVVVQNNIVVATFSLSGTHDSFTLKST